MANFLYTVFKNSYLTASANVVDFDSDTIKACLVRSSTYTPNQTTDDFLADVTSPVATATVTELSISGATVDSTDITFTAVSAGAAIDLLVLYKDTGNAATSRLIGKWDISVTPDGNDVVVVINASGLFAL